jgi:hypothetical protein
MRSPQDPIPGSVVRDRIPPSDPFWRPMWVQRAPRGLFPALLVVLAIVVHLPAITTEFILDDYLHEAMLEGRFPGDRAGWDLYNFVDDANREALAATGLVPWWSHPGLQIRFFRPLSAWLLGVDHALFSGAPLPMHLHSLLWWGLVVLAALWLYRAVLSPRVAAFAITIFVLAPAHAMPLAWLANRDALLSLAFGVPALVLLARFVGSGRITEALAAFGLFALSFLAGEYALCLGGYVLGLALVERQAPIARRTGAIAAFALPGAVYLGVRAALGCGTIGSGFYTDPFRDPGLFLLLAPRRLAHLALNAWLSLSDEAIDWGFGNPLVIGAAILLAGVLFVSLRHALGAFEEAEGRAVRWLLAGSVLALVPVLAVVPAARLLGAAMLGIAPAVAAILEGCWFRQAPGPRRGAREVAASCATVLGFCHLIHAPVITWLACAHHQRASMDAAALAATMPGTTEDFAATEVVSIRGMGASCFAPFALRGPMPRSYRVLAETPHLLVLSEDERTFEMITARDQGLFPRGEGNLYRHLALSSEIGDVHELPEATLTVTDVEAGIPVAARVVLREPAGARVLVHQTTEGFLPVTLPPAGFGLTLDSEPPPSP